MKTKTNNIYVFTTKFVMKDDSPIVRVLHDEDGDWQILGGEGNPVTGERFTKHYYAGTQRIVSKIGNGSFANLYRPGNNILLAGNINCVDRYNQIEAGKTEYIKSLGIPPGPPTMKGIYGEPENTGSAFPDSGTPTNEAPKNWPRKPVQATPGGPPGPPIQYGPEITNETAEAGFGYTSTGYIEESDRYFYHSDHLGSTAYITDRNGKVTQFMSYMPFGEMLVDKHASKNEMPYKFNGKEKDEETGLYYYGARYYNDRDILWISVDPLWEKYPNVSAYAYCHNNPIKYIDPDGLTKYLAITLGKDVSYRGEKMVKNDNSVEHSNVSNGINGIIDILKEATASDSEGIGFISLWSHGAAGMIFGDNWRVDENVIYSSDLNLLQSAINAGDIVFDSNSVIYLGACNAGTDTKTSQSFAEKLAEITGSTVIAANDRVGPKDESGNKLLYTVSQPKKNTFFKFGTESKSKIGNEIDVMQLLEETKQVQQSAHNQDSE